MRDLSGKVIDINTSGKNLLSQDLIETISDLLV